MAMGVNVTLPDMTLGFDARDLVTDIKAELEEHWRASLLRGQKAAGGALPPNGDGRPYGQGDGSIAREWVSSGVSGTAERAEASSAPGQEGGKFYTVRNMVELGADPASIDGKASDIIDAVVARHADKAVKAP